MNLRFALPLALAAAALAQDEPQLVWKGQVDRNTVLKVRRKRLTVEGEARSRSEFHFYAALPESDADVHLEVLEGRGQARIIEQPRASNRYTLSVAIEDPQSSSASYALAFYWQDASSGRRQSLTWSGRVEDEAVISCSGDACDRGRFRFSQPLPARAVAVHLAATDGRGDVRLVEQPAESNDYAARVLVRNFGGGSDDFSFTLAWNAPHRDATTPAIARPGLLWSGKVNGRVRVTVEGRAASSEVLSGEPVTSQTAQFTRALPPRDSPGASVRKLQGRGSIILVETPSGRNHYQLVFEVDDPGGAGDAYEVEARW